MQSTCSAAGTALPKHENQECLQWSRLTPGYTFSSPLSLTAKTKTWAENGSLFSLLGDLMGGKEEFVANI